MKNLETDPSYADLVRRFPPRILHCDEDLAAALGALGTLAPVLRSDLTDGQRVYQELVADLVAQYRSDRESLMARDGDAGEPDEAVLRYLLVAYGHTIADALPEMVGYDPADPDGARTLTLARLSDRAGVPYANLRAVLAGERSFSRGEIARVALALEVSPSLFDRSLAEGGEPGGRRFRAYWYSRENREVMLTDRTGEYASRLVTVNDGWFVLRDYAGGSAPMSAGSVSFLHHLNRWLAANPGRTLTLFFGAKDAGVALPIDRHDPDGRIP